MDLPPLDLLLPVDDAGPIPVEADETRLRDLYRLPSGTPHVRGNMIGTLDGAATGADGRSGSINGPADLRVFTVLRCLADVVLVGAGTARAEGYRAPRLRDDLREVRVGCGRAPDPELAVVTLGGHLPEDLVAGARPPWVVTVGEAPGLPELRRVLPAERLVVHDGEVDLGAALTTLTGAGLLHVLTEGGPRLLGGMLGAGLVDELCLTTSPVVTAGAAARVVDHPTPLSPPTGARLGHLLHADGMLMARWHLTDRG